MLLALASNIIIAQYYGAEIVGVVSLLTSFLAFSGIFTTVGLNTALLRLIPEQITRFSIIEARIIFTKAVKIVTVLGVLASLILWNSGEYITENIYKDSDLNTWLYITTLFILVSSLTRILNNHDELYIPPETYILGKSISQDKRHPFIKWNELVGLILSNFQFEEVFETFQLRSLSGLNNLLKSLPANKRSLAAIINGFYVYYRNTHNLNGTRWGDKTPINTYCLEELSRVFPDAKFIHIIRNPYDSISSYLTAGIYTELSAATERWITLVETCREFGERNSNSYIEVSYCNLVQRPESTTIDVCSFLNIEYQSRMLALPNEDLGDVEMRAHHSNVKKPINPSSLGKGLDSLTQPQKEFIRNRLAQSSCTLVKGFIN